MTRALNIAKLFDHGPDQPMEVLDSAWYDEQDERAEEVAAWREDRKAELYANPQALADAVYDFDLCGVYESLFAALLSMPASDDITMRALHRHDEALKVIDVAIVEILEHEEEMGCHRQHSYVRF